LIDIMPFLSTVKSSYGFGRTTQKHTVLPSGGDTITLSNGRRYHYFTSTSGTYIGSTDYPDVEIMAIGGGGGALDGGTLPGYGGGGGSGNMIIASFTGLSGTYPVSIGSGGTALNNGINTTFNSTYIIALGGGAGGGPSPPAVGGSGGGGGFFNGYSTEGADAALGTVTNGTIISNLANSGGTSWPDGLTAGGGGVGAAAANVNLFDEGQGGAGVLYAGTYYGGGGGGMSASTEDGGASGGIGGGGNGAGYGGTNTPGAPNTGGGGGGGGSVGSGASGSGAGGSGILIVSYAYP
jgi:hypothetical protein